MRIENDKSALFLRQRWEDPSRGVSFELGRVIGPYVTTPDRRVRKSLMEGTIRLNDHAKVNVCVTAWEEEVVNFGPWTKPTEPGVLEGYIWNVCIEQINSPNIARPGTEGLSGRECQEIAFLIEAPLRDLLDQFAATHHRSKFPDGPLRADMLEIWTRAGQKLGASLARGEIRRSHPFAVWAREVCYQLALGVDELSMRRELRSNWEKPAPELMRFHEASAHAVRSFDPQKIANFAFRPIRVSPGKGFWNDVWLSRRAGYAHNSAWPRPGRSLYIYGDGEIWCSSDRT